MMMEQWTCNQKEQGMRMINDVIRIKATHVITLFPNKGKVLGVSGNDFGIVKWRVQEIVDGKYSIQGDEIIIVTGSYACEIENGLTYTILAKEIIHKTYGKQYQLLYFNQDIDFTALPNQRAFLKSFLTDKQIESIYAVCDNPIKVIATHDVDTLTKSWGIGNHIAEAIFNRFEKTKDNCEIFIELDGYGLTPNFIQKLSARYQNPQTVINVVKHNPYQLCFDCDGIGFKTADEIAVKGGLDAKSHERIQAYIFTALNDEAESGNSYIYSGELTSMIFSMFGGKEEILQYYSPSTEHHTSNNISEAIHLLQEKGIVSVEDSINKSKRKVYLTHIHELELNVANELVRLLQSENGFMFDEYENKIADQERVQGWKLTDEQRAGVELCLHNQVVMIAGSAGTGKTSVLSCVLHALGCIGEDQQYSFAQCSLSGKAAARMSEVTGQDGCTIHRLLGYIPNTKRFYHSKKNPILKDVIVVDEISLIGGEIFLSLIQAIKSGSKLILLGDMGQLESIGCMNLAHDLYASKIIPTVNLTKIHRQAEKSGIITAATSVRQQEQFFSSVFSGTQVIGEYQDMILDISKTKDTTVERAMAHFKEQYAQVLKDGGNIMDIQVLTSVKTRGDSCVLKLNQEIQKLVNPHKSINCKEIMVKFSKSDPDKTFYYREGDKVMCIKNNYNAKVAVGDADGHTEIFNGWTGVIEHINSDKKEAVIYFPHANERVLMTEYELSHEMTLGYASTVHKFQGSQCVSIIGVCDYSTPPQMLTKELLYTMLTRAEKMCVLVGQSGAIRKAIESSSINTKNTFLLEFIDRTFCKKNY